MKRVLAVLGALLVVLLLSAPTAVMAQSVTTPTPTDAATSPSSTPFPGGQPQPIPASGGGTSAKDALTIVGFAIVAMAGLVLLLRAGLGAADAEDDD